MFEKVFCFLSRTDNKKVRYTVKEMMLVEVNEETRPVLNLYREVYTNQEGNYRIITKPEHNYILEKFRMN